MILSLPLTRKVLPLLRALGARETLLFCISSAIVLASYAWLNTEATVPVADKEPVSYYQMLTEAFLAGRTYLSLEPDPRLNGLADPWAGAQGIPRAHDATFYNGRYYLYFGTGPVLALMAPWRILTGTYIRDGTATGLFTAAGFLFSGLFYLRFKRRFFRALSPWWTLLAIPVLGWGSFLPFVVSSPRMYDVPITCAFAWCMLSAHAFLTAATARTSRERVGATFLASLAWGIAILARPNYVFGIGPLWLFLAIVYWRSRSSASRSSTVCFWMAAVIPVMAVCAGIATYNYIRFNNPSEFGTTFQFSAMDMRRTKLFSASNVALSFQQYILKGVHRSPYYPFVDNGTDVFGILHWIPLTFVAFAFPSLLFFERLRRQPLYLPLGFLVCAAIVNFATLLPLPFANARYEVDFVPSLTLVAVLVLSTAAGNLAGVPRWAQWLGPIAAIVAFIPSTFDSLASGLPPADTSAGVRSLARVLNLPAEALEHLEGVGEGPVDFYAEFPGGAKGRKEPLVTTAGGGDCVFVEYLGGGRGRIGFFHSGAPGRMSEPVQFGTSKHHVVVEMGGLYPPPEHATFRGWKEDDIVALRRKVEVRIDGEDVLTASASFYRSDPWQLSIGTIPVAGQIAPAFTGTITGVRRLGIPAEGEVRAGYKTGPVRILARLPAFTAIVGQPLVSTGVSGAGDLVFVTYLAPGKARFGHDCWNFGLFETEPILFDPSENQIIEIDMDSLHPLPNGGLHPLRLRFNGREIANVERRFNSSTPEQVAFGYNEIGASTTEVMFSGAKLESTRMSAWPAERSGFGSVWLKLKLPEDRSRGPDPLLVTGRLGAADMVYIRYPDNGHVQIGCDHWGYGGPETDPIAIHNGEAQEVEISLGSLHFEDDPDWPNLSADRRQRILSTLVVHLNGSKVLEKLLQAYPSRLDEIYIGQNPLGGSTCSERFGGTIVSSRRIGAVYQR